MQSILSPKLSRAAASASAPARRALPSASSAAAGWRAARPAVLVLALHLALLWLVSRPGVMLVAPHREPPVVMLATMEAPPAPVELPKPQPVKTVPLVSHPVPRPLVTPAPRPLTDAPTAIHEAPVPPAAPAAAAPVAAAPPAPAPVQTPAPARPPVITSGVEYISAPQPVYPAAALRRGEEGEVLLRVLINAEGAVDEIALQRSSGNASLDRAAREAVQRARFKPYLEQGKAQPAYVVVPIKFQLTQ